MKNKINGRRYYLVYRRGLDGKYVYFIYDRQGESANEFPKFYSKVAAECYCESINNRQELFPPIEAHWYDVFYKLLNWLFQSKK